jgi:hypothetical protein
VPNYPLNEKQKQMIRSLAVALRDRTVSTHFLAVRDLQGTELVPLDKGLSAEKLSGWEDFNEGDLGKFTKLGFFQLVKSNKDSTEYTIDDFSVCEADERNFVYLETGPVQGSTTIFHGNTFTGITNINATLNNSTQYINDSPSLEDDFKKQFNALLDQLKQQLADVPEEAQPDANELAKYAERMAQDISEKEPDKEAVGFSAKKFERAAVNISKIAVPVLATALEIIALVKGAGLI